MFCDACAGRGVEPLADDAKIILVDLPYYRDVKLGVKPVDPAVRPFIRLCTDCYTDFLETEKIVD